MKNFKKVVFGLLAMLVMVTGVSATTSSAAVSSTSYIDNDVRDEADLKACMSGTQSRNEVVCSLTRDVEIATTNLFAVSGNNTTLNLNGHKLTFKGGHAIIASGDLNVNGGTIVFAGATDKIIIGNTAKNVTINNVTLNSDAASYLVEITGGTTKNNITLSNVTAINESGAIIDYKSGAAKLNVSGTFTAEKEDVVIEAGNPEVTLDGTFTSNTVRSYVEYSAAATKATIKGTYTSKGNTFTISNSDVTINATATSKDGTVIDAFNTSGVKLTIEDGKYDAGVSVISALHGGEITIEKGNFTSKDKTVNTDNVKIIINDGTFTSDAAEALYLAHTNANGSKVNGDHFKAASAVMDGAKILYGGEFEGDNENEVTLTRIEDRVAPDYSAVRIGDIVYVGKTYRLYVEVDSENGSIIKKVNYVDNMLAGHEYKFADKNVKEFINVKANEGYVVKYELVYGEDDEKVGTVTADGFVMPDEDATLKVSFVKAEEQKPADQQPSDTPSSGANDGEDVKPNENTNTNPSTFDGIASIVTMAVSSLGAAGYSIKKIIRK